MAFSVQRCFLSLRRAATKSTGTVCAPVKSTAAAVSCRPYTVAITREVPESLADGLCMNSDDNSIVSVPRAKEQHDVYVNHLRSILPTFSLPPLTNHPDCVFVEDTAVAIGRHAVINRIGHKSRQGEVNDVKITLQQFGMSVTDMRLVNEEATCDGGDVLCVEGKKLLFVGLSKRTNQEGVDVLKSAFEPSGIKVVPVPLMDDGAALHLKSVVTCLDDKTLLAPTGPLGDNVLSSMQANKWGLTTIRLPDIAACNAVTVNGQVLAQDTQCKKSKQILEQETRSRRLGLQFVDTSEFAKIDGALTCCSILVNA